MTLSPSDRVPDYTAALPTIRTFTPRGDRICATVVKYDYLPGENVATHKQTVAGGYSPPINAAGTIAWQGLAAFINPEDYQPPEHETPTPGCECGFYGWYPWATSRFHGVTPLDPDPARQQWAAPHPAVRDAIVTWWYQAGSISSNPQLIDQIDTRVVGVLDTYGKVVIHDHGVRAGKARIRALIDPQSIARYAMPSELHEWRTLLHQSWITASNKAPTLELWLPQLLTKLGALTLHLSHVYDVPILDFHEALELSTEWAQLRDQIQDNQSGTTAG